MISPMPKKRALLIVCCGLLSVVGLLTNSIRMGAQTPTRQLVVDGGTLIDGNGGAPVRDVQLGVQGDPIANIGKKGDAIPAGAQVLRADGKWIVPGLWDAQLNFYSYQGE